MSPEFFQALRNMKLAIQIATVELMILRNDLSVAFAKTRLALTPPDLLNVPSASKRKLQITTGKATNIAQLAAIDGVSPRFIRMQMKLVQLSPQSIENLMARPESLPLSLNDLLSAIPMDWREQSLGLSTKSA